MSNLIDKDPVHTRKRRNKLDEPLSRKAVTFRFASSSTKTICIQAEVKNQEVNMTTNTELQGTIVAGRIELDQPVELPDSSRVAVTLRPLVQPATTDRREAWHRLKRRISDRPIHAGGEKFVRSDLYERD